MRIVIVVAVTLLVFAGCSEGPATPAGIIPPDSMKVVMYDMMRSGEFLSGYVLYKDTSVNKIGESMKWYSKVWQIHKVSEAEFRKSYEWYKEHPKMMSALMDSIMVIPTPPLPKQATKDSIAPVDSIRNRLDSSRQRKLMIRERSRDSLRRRGLPGLKP